uniref:Uncharacterized protein n=1 Tax=Strongyloides venezuelensis TaxID=75913 RepID=A0A0K0FJM7_STRVS
MTFKFCGLKYVFNNIALFKKDDKKSSNVIEKETDVSQRYAVFNRARSLKLVGPNLVSKGADVFKVETIINDDVSFNNEEVSDEK